MTVRVLQVIAGAEHGGTESTFERLVPALQRAGVEQQVLIRHNPRRAALLREAGIDVVEAPFGGFFDLRTRNAFRSRIRTFKPQVVMTWMNRARRFCPRSSAFTHVMRLGGDYEKKHYRGCDHLIGNTHEIVDHIVAQGWPQDRAHYLPSLISEQTAPPVPRKEIYIPEGAPVALALGRLHKGKGFDVLLKALVRVPDVYLLLAGEGDGQAELEGLAQRLGVKPRVRFLGWRDDVPSLFATADFFVCPSRHDPLGNVVVEAWAQGMPVIATASPGPSSLIQSEVNGLLVPVDEPGDLAAAIHRLMVDKELARRLGREGRKAYDEAFTEAVVVAQYREFFERIATQSPSA